MCSHFVGRESMSEEAWLHVVSWYKPFRNERVGKGEERKGEQLAKASFFFFFFEIKRQALVGEASYHTWHTSTPHNTTPLASARPWPCTAQFLVQGPGAQPTLGSGVGPITPSLVGSCVVPLRTSNPSILPTRSPQSADACTRAPNNQSHSLPYLIPFYSSLYLYILF